MTFVNEVVSDEDIAKYSLPFKPGDRRYWTRDKERDFYFWGRIMGSYVRESPPKGEFHLYIRGVLLEVWLQATQSELPTFITSDMVSWKRISLMRPYDLGGLDRDEVVAILKEALMVFGVNGSPAYSPNRSRVSILF
jgi:hypothetical protein